MQILLGAERNYDEDYVTASRAISMRRTAVESCIQFALHCLEGAGRQLPPGLKIARAKSAGKAKAKAKAKAKDAAKQQ